MDIKDKARFNMFIRVIQYLIDNAGDFSAGSVAMTQLAVLQAVVAALNSLTGEQRASFGDARFAFVSKDTARENLREAVAGIVKTARSMVYQFPGIDKKFAMPRNLSDLNMLAVARAFLSEAPQYKAEFIAFELNEDFLTELQAAIIAFEQSMNPTGAAMDAQTAATAEIGAEVRKGMIAVRILNGVIRNKYKNNVGKLAAWTSASHVEKTSGTPQTPLTN